MEKSGEMSGTLQDKRRRTAEAKLREILEAGEAGRRSDKTVDEIWTAAEARFLKSAMRWEALLK